MTNVLITGASSGIGAATAILLDRQGVNVFAGVEAPDDGQQALAGSSERLRRVVLDVSSEASIRAALAEIDRDLGGAGLDGVVNNAGVGVPGPLEALPLDQLRRQLDVNVIGQVAVTQAVLPLIRRTRGRIVFVGSIGGILASQFAGAYHASKFAIEAIADVWRQELEPEGLAVILIEPSVISTPIWEKAIASLDGLANAGSPRLEPYRDRLRSFRDSLRSADEHGKSPDAVAETIAEALSTERPDTRYVVGGAGKLARALRPLVPDRLADKLAERTTSA
jgi:NAD(P)-dependent dehydrogenase (short-subunit alcohol dehydrogenase family)